jgi:uncharacterized protein (DUF433 family)
MRPWLSQLSRVPVEVILGSLAGGMSYEEVEREYDITREDILAARVREKNNLRGDCQNLRD